MSSIELVLMSVLIFYGKLKNGDTNIKFDKYDQFYNKTDEIVTFK